MQAVTIRPLRSSRFPIVEMKWKYLPKPETLVYYMAKLTGLAPIRLKSNRFHPSACVDKIYAAAVAAGTLFALLLTFWESYKLPRAATTSIHSHILRFHVIVTFGSLALVPILFSSTSKRIANLMTDLCLISNDLKKFGIVEDREIIFRNILLTSSAAYALIVTLSVIAQIVDTAPMIIMINFGVRNLATINIVLSFVEILICIRRRFLLLNKRLGNVFIAPARRVESHQSSRIFLVDVDFDEDLSGVRSLTNRQRIQRAGSLHAELCNLLNRTIRLFAVPMLFISVQSFCNLVLYAHWIYNNYLSRLSIDEDIEIAWRHGLGSILQMLIVVVELFVVVHVSHTTCQQGNATSQVLAKVWNEFHPAGLKDQFLMMFVQMLHRPVAVSVLGFFGLDYSFAYKIFCAAVAYLIIVVQLDTSRGGSGT